MVEENIRDDARLTLDDPSLDATDFAHPAWWRGEEYAIRQICAKISNILDGKDKGTGVYQEPFESLRRRLLRLVEASKGKT